MEELIHDAACIAAQEQWQKKAAQYDAAWPNHCQECAGAGGKAVKYDPSPSGVGLSPGYFVDFEPCDECYGKGICPRCGQRMITSEGDEIPETCPRCNWTFTSGCGRPLQPECWCWEAQIYAQDHPEQID